MGSEISLRSPKMLLLSCFPHSNLLWVRHKQQKPLWVHIFNQKRLQHSNFACGQQRAKAEWKEACYSRNSHAVSFVDRIQDPPRNCRLVAKVLLKLLPYCSQPLCCIVELDYPANKLEGLPTYASLTGSLDRIPYQ